MLAIVATTCYLLLVDLASAAVTPLEGGRPEYYGISWFPGARDLVLGHSGLDNTTLVDVSAHALSETGWISSGNKDSPIFLSGPHQLLCASDGRVVCTNTGRNAISVIDLARPGHFQEARISRARWDRLAPDNGSGDHLNSVFEKDGRLYVLAHGHIRGSKLAIFSYPDLELISVRNAGNRSGMHNIWANDEQQLISCHSQAGAVVDIAADETLWESGSQVFTRGLAVSADLIVVGESQKTGRDLRRSSTSGLWIIDRHNWKTMDYLCLGPYGGVNEVRLLDVPDEAHHGHRFAGSDSIRGRSMLHDIAQDRMRAMSAASSAREAWRDYELILGAPETAPDGARFVSSDNLCLALQKSNAAERVLDFEYALSVSAIHSHVSAVIGYQGNGGDTSMASLLLQPSGNAAVLSLWRNDGLAWSVIPGVSATELPLSGRIRLCRHDGDISLSIDGKEILRLPAAEFSASEKAMGIRWLGASVKPCAL